jgi:hypothetical protein
VQVPSPEIGNKTLTGTLESLNVGVKECKGWFSQALPWEELIYGQKLVVSSNGNLSLVCPMDLSIIIYIFQSLKVTLLTRKRMSTSDGLRMKTSLCYNPALERMTCAIFQAEGVQVSTSFMVNLIG